MSVFARAAICVISLVLLASVAMPVLGVQSNGVIFSSELCEIASAQICDSTAFAPLEDALSLLFESFEVELIRLGNGISATVSVSDEGGEFEAIIRDGNNYMVLNGEYFHLGKECYTEKGVLFVPVRRFLSAFDACIVWDSASRSAVVIRLDAAQEDLSVLTNENSDLYWLSRIISAESRGEPFEGQIAVGNVILARVASGIYPDTIYEVIFDAVPCTQFTPVENCTVYDAPAPSCIAAARLCLSGYTIESIRGCLFFQNPLTTRSGWVSENREFAVQIGAHAFYY